MYPNIMKLISFRDTIAVCSAECEKSFSTMNRVKTPGPSSMSDIRTSDLVLLAQEKNLAKVVKQYLVKQYLNLIA